MDYQNVNGHGDLARDPKTNSIVNVNGLEYEKYIARRKAKIESSKKVESIEDELEKLKDDISEIKYLLKEMVNGNKSREN